VLSLGNVIAVIAALIAGMMVSLQSRLNGELGLAMSDGIGAALYSFTSGLILITVIWFFSPRARNALWTLLGKIKSGEIPVWMLLGGAFGGFLVASQGLSAGIVGISLFTVAVVAGQSVSAIVIDSRGWFGVTKRRLSLIRILGALSVVVGVGLVAEQPDMSTLWLLLLPFAAGLGLGFQQAANGRVRLAADNAIAATLMNFAVGALTLLIMKLVTTPLVGISSTYPNQWWLYMGGFAGVIFIAIQVIVVSKIGVLGLGVMLGTGQLIGSLLLDVLAPISAQPTSLVHYLGVLVALIGAIVVNLKR
jgi:bacterial/archaeal transporter family-2 protein